jgi:pimeloyl-ACP methyl ester carboxylesterase
MERGTAVGAGIKAVPELESRGHTVVALDLPALAENHTPPAEITLLRYVDAVCDALAKEDEPVLLAGHSMGGIVISEAAERLPEKIRRLVYVSAYLLVDGQSIMQIVQEDEHLSKLAGFLVSDGVVCTLREDKIRETFYGRCATSDADWAASMLVPQPLAPFGSPVRVTAEMFGRVPRAYIKCLQDRTVPLSAQDRMLSATPCHDVVSIDTDHSPHLSTPVEFAEHISSFCS